MILPINQRIIELPYKGLLPNLDARNKIKEAWYLKRGVTLYNVVFITSQQEGYT